MLEIPSKSDEMNVDWNFFRWRNLFLGELGAEVPVVAQRLNRVVASIGRRVSSYTYGIYERFVMELFHSEREAFSEESRRIRDCGMVLFRSRRLWAGGPFLRSVGIYNAEECRVPVCLIERSAIFRDESCTGV